MKHPKQLQIHNESSGNGENTNSTNKGGDLRLVNKLRTIPRGRERMLRVEQRNWAATVHLLTDPQEDNDETNKI